MRPNTTVQLMGTAGLVHVPITVTLPDGAFLSVYSPIDFLKQLSQP